MSWYPTGRDPGSYDLISFKPLLFEIPAIRALGEAIFLTIMDRLAR